jgi:hypothetical protein
MISWVQLCEMETCNKTSKNFYFQTSLLQFLTEDELKLVYVESLAGSATGDSIVKIWYPADEWNKFQERLKEYLVPKVKKVKESKIESVCCNADVHLYKNRRLNIETLVCLKCFKECKTKLK